MAYLVSADDLWDWEQGEVSTLARRLLSEEELQKFIDNVTREIRYLAESFESSEMLSASLYMKRRLEILSRSIGELIEQSTQD